MAGLAFIAATGGAILDDSSIQTARAVETTVVNLVLPNAAPIPNHQPGSSSGSVGDVVRSAPLERASNRPAGSHLQLTATDRDSAADSFPLSSSDSPELEHIADIDADVEPAPGVSAVPSTVPEGIVPVDANAPTVVVPSHRVTVSSGDSLYLIFKRLGLPQRDLALMTGLKPLASKLARISPRQELEFYVDTESRLTRLVHRLDRIRSLHVFRDGDSFSFEEVVEPPEVSAATATGVIDSSLFEAGQRAGLSDSLIMQMAEIFGWDVDFALDIRSGDRFTLGLRGAVQGRGQDR